jgi:hypothetical protein
MVGSDNVTKFGPVSQKAFHRQATELFQIGRSHLSHCHKQTTTGASGT